MPIVNYCSTKEEAEKLGADVYKYNETTWVYKTHIGCCISERERNGYHDSDFYMTVWDFETNSPKEIEFATTRGWCAPCFNSSIDATEEVLKFYKEWYYNLHNELKEKRRIEELNTPSIGKKVIVIKGKYKDKQGKVFWKGTNKFKRTKFNSRIHFTNPNTWPENQVIGIEESSGNKFFIPVLNAKVQF